ncbi:lymphatic vessel endothelial hyaluronic acid receptor 1a [Neoarius graeffei]|uniref:lymphatic vessel endothelial hyaluronic acid receptor 1a n=1 Tax=Neoarius graeffei TaxID=443677 RepID=UPI00298CE2B3|nr:lymphatic vessel endothelial hyaluronic acid receptor 1a [Neoarius graeffei]
MANTGMLLLLLAHFITSALLIDVTKIRVYPKHGSVYGVFHASLSSGYAFKASEARDVCEQLGVAIADKAQVEKARAHGFETCKFGWIDEQVAIIPRIQAKESCGQGRVGIITWRASLTTPFDVFCFNLTDYEARLNTVQENPSTTITPTTRTSGVDLKQAKTARSASWDDLRSTSSSLPESADKLAANNLSELQVFSNVSNAIAVGLIALVTTVFAFLVLAVAAVCYFKKNKSPQKGSIETGKESQTELKNQHKMTSCTNDASVTIKPENEKGVPS